MADEKNTDPVSFDGNAVVSTRPRHERVGSEQDGQRVDNFLIRHCPGVPRSHIYQLIRKGAVLVDGKRIKQTRKLVAGEQVRIPAMQTKPQAQVHVPEKLARAAGDAVIFENDDFLVINKPAGIAVHGGSGLAFGLIDALRQERDEKRLELSHRIDRATSGCLLVGRGLKVNRQLQDLFRQRAVSKCYKALVAGVWPETLRQVNAPLLKNVEQAGERRVIVSTDGQTALTRFSVSQRYCEATLLDVELETGRTHQIRVHTKHAGYPIVGDGRYGNNRQNTTFKRMGLARLYLHSYALSFEWHGEQIEVTAQPDAAWQASLQNLGRA